MSKYDEVVNTFIRDHADMFVFIWGRNDLPTDHEVERLADAWYDDHDDNPPFSEVEKRISELATEFDWSFRMEQPKDDYPYEYSDFLFDSDREDRYFGRR